jgi:hypothetical protein
MMRLGLGPDDFGHLIRTLFSDHTRRFRVQSLTLNGQWDADLTPLMLDGQVSVDATADVTRTLDLTLLDPHHTLDFDSDSPSDTALYLDRMIRVWYGVLIDYGHGEGWEWEDIPVFTGPITELSRSGPEISVSAEGKEGLVMGAVWRPITIPKKRTKVAAIRIIMRERGGETRFGHFPNIKAKLPRDLSLNREDIIWTRCRSLARSLNLQLFYDGAGECRLRRHPGRPVVTFTDDSMISPLQVDYSIDVVNAVFVRGGIPKTGEKVQINATEVAPASHPLSPWRLGRHGEPRYLLETVEDSSIRSYAEARRHARQRLAHGLAQGVDASFDCLPLPMLDPGDMVEAHTGDGAVTFRANSFGIPLGGDSPMSMGYHRNLRTGRLGHPKLHRHTREWAQYRHRAIQKLMKGGKGAKDDLTRKQALAELRKHPKPKKHAAQPKTHHAHHKHHHPTKAR